MTYRDIVTLEPRVADVINGVRPCRSRQRRSEQYEAAKTQLLHLVGARADVSEVRTPQAYSCAIQQHAKALRI